MIIDDAEKCYYFPVKSILKLYSSEWLKNKKASISNDNNSFQNALNDAFNCYNIESNPERISNIEPFIKQYNWKGIEFTSHKKDWKKFEQNNRTIALNILYVPCKTKKISLAYKSNYNQKRNNQVNLLMITDGKNGIILLYKACRHCLEE